MGNMLKLSGCCRVSRCLLCVRSGYVAGLENYNCCTLSHILKLSGYCRVSRCSIRQLYWFFVVYFEGSLCISVVFARHPETTVSGFGVVGGVSGGEAAVVSSVEAEEDGLLVASC